MASEDDTGMPGDNETVDHVPTNSSPQPDSSVRSGQLQGSRASTGDRKSDPDKPLVDPPQYSERIKDTDKKPYWIPGAHILEAKSRSEWIPYESGSVSLHDLLCGK